MATHMTCDENLVVLGTTCCLVFPRVLTNDHTPNHMPAHTLLWQALAMGGHVKLA